MSDNASEQIGGFAASAIWLLYTSGILALVLAVIAALRTDFVGAGVCLAAAALAHGLLLNGLIRR